MKNYTIQEYIDAGCNEIKVTSMQAVWIITGGMVCDTGCHAFANGKCDAYKKLTIAPKPVIRKPMETVRQEAVRRGLSISEVRRQRRSA